MFSWFIHLEGFMKKRYIALLLCLHITVFGQSLNKYLGNETLEPPPMNTHQQRVLHYGLSALDLNESETEYFFGFLDMRYHFAYGGLDYAQIVGGKTTINPDSVTSVKLKFGTGRTQKAHMFNRYNGYSYGGFIDIPFEVWDTQSGRQLTVAFADYNQDGKWNLDDGRNYIWVYYDTYSTEENSEITATAGSYISIARRAMFLIAPKQNDSGINETNMPDSELLINAREKPLLTGKIAAPVQKEQSYSFGKAFRVWSAEKPTLVFNNLPGGMSVVNDSLKWLPVDVPQGTYSFQIIAQNSHGSDTLNTSVDVMESHGNN